MYLLFLKINIINGKFIYKKAKIPYINYLKKNNI